ncbi:MAG: hypothetical protein ACP5SH_24945 [Syntrophobacteraceae bacterium]
MEFQTLVMQTKAILAHVKMGVFSVIAAWQERLFSVSFRANPNLFCASVARMPKGEVTRMIGVTTPKQIGKRAIYVRAKTEVDDLKSEPQSAKIPGQGEYATWCGGFERSIPRGYNQYQLGRCTGSKPAKKLWRVFGGHDSIGAGTLRTYMGIRDKEGCRSEPSERRYRYFLLYAANRKISPHTAPSKSYRNSGYVAKRRGTTKRGYIGEISPGCSEFKVGGIGISRIPKTKTGFLSNRGLYRNEFVRSSKRTRPKERSSTDRFDRRNYRFLLLSPEVSYRDKTHLVSVEFFP